MIDIICLAVICIISVYSSACIYKLRRRCPELEENFISHQKEYLQLTSGSDKIFETMERLSEEGKIPMCTPALIGDDYGRGTNYVHEQYAYILMEIYEGKHNELLQQIINKTKEG